MILTPAGSTGAVAGAGLTHQRRWESATLVVTELVLLVVLLDIYDLVVPHAVGDAPGADVHGWAVGPGERVAHRRRAPVATALSGHPLVAGAAHVYYAESICLAPAVVAILLVVRDVAGYRRMRNAFVATTLLAYGAFWLYPVAPPCLLPESGLTCGEPAPPDRSPRCPRCTSRGPG